MVSFLSFFRVFCVGVLLRFWCLFCFSFFEFFSMFFAENLLRRRALLFLMSKKSKQKNSPHVPKSYCDSPKMIHLPSASSFAPRPFEQRSMALGLASVERGYK
jgi:hypothetical protein